MNSLLLASVLLFQPAAAAAEESEAVPITQGLAEFHDPTGKLDIETLSSSAGASKFKDLLGPVPYRRRVEGHLWIRFHVHNPEARTVRRYVRVEWLRLGEVSFFAPTRRGIQRAKSGFVVPFSERPEWDRDIAFPVDLAPDERREVYLRVRTRAELRVPISVASERVHSRQRAFGSLSTGVFGGMLLGLSVFSIVVFLRLRHRMYLYFALHMIWFLIWWLLARGWGGALDLGAMLTAFLFGLSLDIWLFARLAFTRSLLRLDAIAPRLDRLLFGFQAVGIPLLFLSQVLAPAYAVLTGSLAPLLLLGLELYAGRVAVRAGSRLAPWYLVATTGLLAGLLLAFLILSGAIPLGLPTARWTIRLGALGELFGLAFVLAESIREVTRSRERALGQVEAERLRAANQLQMIEQVRLREREQIARDLHDSVAHHVSGIAIRAQSGLAIAQTASSAEVEALRAINEEAAESLSEMRSIVGSLRKDSPEPHAGLLGLERLSEDVGLPVELRVVGDRSSVSDSVGRAVYRIVQEGVTNARRHARGANRIDASVSIDDRSVTFEIVNDGAEVLSPTSNGYGLIGMKERALLLGGHLEAGPKAHGGWRVKGSLPKRAGLDASKSGMSADSEDMVGVHVESGRAVRR